MLNKSRMKRNEKMARTKNRIKKMNFQTQDREFIEISDEHKGDLRFCSKNVWNWNMFTK